LLAIQTCHRRNAPCIGGMAAQIPIKHDERANAEAMKKVRLDKEREAKDGHDGTWVAHPGLVPVAREVFDQYMTTPNQIHKKREDVKIEAKDLLAVPEGMITEYGLRKNIRVAMQYLEAWLKGSGAAAIDHLMEDAATAEISRAQVWHWIRHEKGILSDGRKINAELVRQWIDQEFNKLRKNAQDDSVLSQAKEIFSELVFEDEFSEFLTLNASRYLD
jgi:malate synthase